MADQQLYRLPDPPVIPWAEDKIDFGGVLTFMGQRLIQKSPEKISLLSAWSVQRPSERPLKIFVHALDEEGNILGQWDDLGVAVNNVQPGDVFVQWHEFELPAEQPVTNLSIGIYDGSTLARMGEPYTYLLGNP